MGMDASVSVVIGFPVKVSDICEVVAVPSCQHSERIGATFCPLCGVKVGANPGLMLKDALRTPIDWRHADEVVKIAGVGLVERFADCNAKTADDNRFLCGIIIGQADVLQTPKAGLIALDSLTPTLERVKRAHAVIPGAPGIAIHIIPSLSY